MGQPAHKPARISFFYSPLQTCPGFELNEDVFNPAKIVSLYSTIYGAARI
ncbi:hypothetical protein J4456_03400 [Candidatus Pacearchaeota archaeon]|nr:hypothetical protein [Candidatus Pacearchaeota archaeon]